MARFPFSGLRLKLVAVTLVGVLTAFAVVGGLRVRAERDAITAEMNRSGTERASLIAEAVANLVVGYDYSNMESLAERIVREEDVQSIVIRNRNGKIMVVRERPGLPGQALLTFERPVLFNGNPVGRVELRLSLARMEARIDATYREVLLEQSFLALFLGLLIYLGASRFIVRPVTCLTRHMQAILEAPDGAEVPPLADGTRDELGELARIFNALQTKVREAQQRLREKIDLAGTALMATNEQLEARTRELEARTKDLEKALALLEKVAVTDSLTELRNRRYFDDALAAAFARAQRFDEPLCLALVDVDRFKEINDTFGHAAGDAVLQSLAAVFRARTRDTDVVARLGGDEFAFLLYRTGLEEGRVFAEDLLARANTLRFHFHGREVQVGLSIGLTCSEGWAHSVEALYGAADEALYEAKRRGRNRVVVYPFRVREDAPLPS